MSFAQTITIMPVPGSQVQVSQQFEGARLMGLQIDPKNPFRIDFLANQGQDVVIGEYGKKEYLKLIKYFMSALTVPNQDQWVNLSPYESKRIVSNDLSLTKMGRDLLAQDYLLKQLTASLMYPEKEIGQKFWKEVYAKIRAQYGANVHVPVNTFNKVWIMPETAVLYEHGNQVWVVKSSLNVMLEEDYLALEKNQISPALVKEGVRGSSAIGSKIIRDVVIPIIKKEVNEGKNFAVLRQIYNAIILATWYKTTLKNSILTKVYADKSKIKGIDQNQKAANDRIYEQYLKAFKKGVYNYIKEEADPLTGQIIPRKYFSGGFESRAMTTVIKKGSSPAQLSALAGSAAIRSFNQNAAQTVGIRVRFRNWLLPIAAAATLLIAPSLAHAQTQTALEQVSADSGSQVTFAITPEMQATNDLLSQFSVLPSAEQQDIESDDNTTDEEGSNVAAPSVSSTPILPPNQSPKLLPSITIDSLHAQGLSRILQ